MLRIRTKIRPLFDIVGVTEVTSAMADQPEVEIVPVFEDPYLELTRLLREAANIEHALTLQYLFAAYSARDRYFSSLAGPAGNHAAGLVGVAVQEMRHLSLVNRLLVEIGAQPNIDRQDFPIRSDIYPFELTLEPLTRASLAKYLVAESPRGELDPTTAGSDDERRYRELVRDLLGAAAVNQIGSLYRAIVLSLRAAAAARPALIADLESRLRDLDLLIAEGEIGHYRLLKSVFLSTHPAFSGIADPWADPDSPDYPSRRFELNRTAFAGAPNAIADEDSRRLAWLSNLHYWAILALLHYGHAAGRGDLVGQAKSHMLSALHGLGRHLAARDVGLPFDAMALNFDVGSDTQRTAEYLRSLMREIIAVQGAIEPLLPPATLYRKSLAQATLTMIGG
jgi:rubrerythrin